MNIRFLNMISTRLDFAHHIHWKGIHKSKWDHGYLVVMAKYAHNQDEEEEYIDLIPILKNLYYDAHKFLTPIKKVRVQYD